MYCLKCDVDVTDDMDHCDDCDVCVEDHDHHCVFFSKCIGAGNFPYFGGAIGLLVVNFAIMFAILLLEDVEQGFGAVPKHHTRV